MELLVAVGALGYMMYRTKPADPTPAIPDRDPVRSDAYTDVDRFAAGNNGADEGYAPSGYQNWREKNRARQRVREDLVRRAMSTNRLREMVNGIYEREERLRHRP